MKPVLCTLIISIILLLTLTGCATQTSQATRIVTASAQPGVTPTRVPRLTVIQVFTGRDTAETPVFRISDDIFLKWQGDPSSNAAGKYSLVVTVYSAIGRVLAVPINVIVNEGYTHDATELHNAGGGVYFGIIALGSWQITVSEYE